MVLVYLQSTHTCTSIITTCPLYLFIVFTGRLLTLDNYTVGLLTIITSTFCTNWRWWSEILTMFLMYTKIIFTRFCSYNESHNLLSVLKAITPLLLILVRNICTDITKQFTKAAFRNAICSRGMLISCELLLKISSRNEAYPSKHFSPQSQQEKH